ncbi:MAG: YIP1 family protein [Ignavibacteriales bacterium]|nr:YIP1 family protein [Ignavibacteriales bacterium]
MSTLSNILVAPSDAFEEIRTRPRWFLASLTCLVTFFVLVWLAGCWKNVTDGFTLSYLLGPALISPMIVGIVSLGSTTFLYLMNMVVWGERGEAPGFRMIFSLNIHCAAIILLGEIFNFLMVRANVLGDSEFALPNRFPAGLDLFFFIFGNPGPYATILLHSTSVFVLWYLFVLAKGMAVLTASSRLRSGLIAASLWFVAVATAMSLAYAAGGGTVIRIRME